MGEDIRVDPVDLFVSAAATEQGAEEFQTASKSATSAARGSQHGWVGVSARALDSLVAGWERTTSALNRSLCEHADNLRASGNAYSATDETTSSRIAAAGYNSRKPRPRLNLD